MAAGLALGKTAPGVGHALEPLIPFGLFLMIYPYAAFQPEQTSCHKATAPNNGTERTALRAAAEAIRWAQ